MDVLDRANSWRKKFRSFCEKKIGSAANNIGEDGIAWDAVHLLAASGWHGLAIPAKYGGIGAGHMRLRGITLQKTWAQECRTILT